MESFLNIVWLLLALPAVFVWRSDLAPCWSSRKYSNLRSLLFLGCMLMLLFPVVSASDDLHPICTEIEESSAGKHIVKSPHGSRLQAWDHTAALPPNPAGANSFNEVCGMVPDPPVVLIFQTAGRAEGCRAPPIYSLTWL